MKRVFGLGVSTLFCLFLAACGHDSGDHGHEGHGSPQAEAGAAADSGSVTLSLNNGQKWPMDQHTRDSAAELLRLVREGDPLTSPEEAQALAGSISTELDKLIVGCTMTGPAHDQLHVFLAALFPRVEELRGATDPPTWQKAHDHISSLFDAYEQTFE